LEINQQMHIMLTIHHKLDLNTGAPGITCQLGHEYQKLGHEISYYSFSDLPSHLSEIAQTILFPVFMANHLFKVNQQNFIDVIDASTGDAWIWAKLNCNNNDYPLLITRSHGLEHIMHQEILAEAKQENLQLSWKYPLYHGGFRLWEVATSLREADLALFSNRIDLKYAVERLNVQPQRAATFVNGVPEELIGLPYEATPIDDMDTIRIAQLGSYIPRKGVRYGAQALNQILTRHSQVMISFLGTGCTEAEVYNDFEPSIRDRVKVIPRYSRDDLPTLLQGHHIKLFPTLSEGFSVALVEAMACGLLPVTTMTPGAMEIVSDKVNGLLIPPRNSQAIVESLERLIYDRTYLEQLRRQSYQTAQNYSWKKIAAINLALYEQAKHIKETRKL
jgi:glycosyltransferase involved in cell wall biosynthesis